VIELKANEKLRAHVQTLIEEQKDRAIPEWLALDVKSLTARVVKMPVRSEIAIPVQEQSIVELYSK
jgi:small subunit ribosomal protein S4